LAGSANGITFRHAIARRPGRSFPQGITTSTLPVPSLELALEQHERYCDELRACGLEVTVLAADDALADSTFVEDAAVVSAQRALIARPGASSRRPEVEAIRAALGTRVSSEIEAPGTLDGGDVCDAGERVFVGRTARTNADGARQFAAWVSQGGKTPIEVDMSGYGDILHLKSAVAYLGDGRFAVDERVAGIVPLSKREIVAVDARAAYAANCVRVNETVLIAAGYPHFERTLAGLGYRTIALDVSEFRKMDGGLSCLSIRF
jgi:dimethylargininase